MRSARSNHDVRSPPPRPDRAARRAGPAPRPAALSLERGGALLSYSFFCLITLGHFLDGKPDIAPFWFATIFTDALAGLAVLAFVVWSARAPVAAPP